MQTDDPLYPDPSRPATLAAEIGGFFAALPFVYRVAQFGSQVHGPADRWSDLDMIVVTAWRRENRALLDALHSYKPFLHHAPVRKSDKHPGANALSIVFSGESPFHCLDLNFIALADYATPGATSWLAPIRDCYVAPVSEHSPAAENGDAYELDDRDPLEALIDAGCFWTRRAAKGLLRGKSSRAELERRHADLTAVMHAMPDDCAMPGGNACRVARAWLAIAAALLRSA